MDSKYKYTYEKTANYCYDELKKIILKYLWKNYVIILKKN